MRKTIFALLALAALLISTAQAATTRIYDVTSADGSGSSHSLWFAPPGVPGLGQNFRFDPPYLPTGVGTLVLDDMAETGKLTGNALHPSEVGTGWIIEFNYDKNFPAPYDPPQFKSENGSAPGADIEYWNFSGGTLTGVGLLDGITLGVSLLPADGKFNFQISSSIDGVKPSANNKNTNFGGAHWGKVTNVEINQDICFQSAYCEENFDGLKELRGRQIDINVDLTPVPVPAPLALMLSGIAGMLGFSRRNKS
ncbi:MAG: hypothetical protein AAGB35_00035 [Pseudomonadota bacterium]